MSSKKKVKKMELETVENMSITDILDPYLTNNHRTLVEEIQAVQIKLDEKERQIKKKRKKEMKKKKKKGANVKDFKSVQWEARKEILDEMNETNLLERVYQTLSDFVPIVIVIARLIITLIDAILNLNWVKVRISPEMLKKIEKVYKKAMSVC